MLKHCVSNLAVSKLNLRHYMEVRAALDGILKRKIKRPEAGPRQVGSHHLIDSTQCGHSYQSTLCFIQALMGCNTPLLFSSA